MIYVKVIKKPQYCSRVTALGRLSVMSKMFQLRSNMHTTLGLHVEWLDGATESMTNVWVGVMAVFVGWYIFWWLVSLISKKLPFTTTLFDKLTEWIDDRLEKN